MKNIFHNILKNMQDINYVSVSNDTDAKTLTYIFLYNSSIAKENVKKVVYMQIFYALDKNLFLFKYNIK